MHENVSTMKTGKYLIAGWIPAAKRRSLFFFLFFIFPFWYFESLLLPARRGLRFKAAQIQTRYTSVVVDESSTRFFSVCLCTRWEPAKVLTAGVRGSVHRLWGRGTSSFSPAWELTSYNCWQAPTTPCRGLVWSLFLCSVGEIIGQWPYSILFVSGCLLCAAPGWR